MASTISEMTTPPMSRTSSQSSRGRRSPMSIDLSNLPPLIQPSPPSNTLLITNLNNPTIFLSPTLAHIRHLITTHSPAGIHTFSPLRSLRRIIITFPDIASAISIRSLLDGQTLFNDRVKIYFGTHLEIDHELSERERHLQAPDAGRLFFISPPPSPPHGWESREEGAPNKEVYAEDLVRKLERLSQRGIESGIVAAESGLEANAASPTKRHVETTEKSDTGFMKTAYAPVKRRSTGNGNRQRSGSTIVYQPEVHGSSPGLPAIAVEDTTESSEPWDELEEQVREKTEGEVGGKKILAHTSRPPVELMNDV